MFRVVSLLTLLFISLSACNLGYYSCKKKIVDSNSIVAKTLQIPIKRHQRVVFSRTIPKYKIIKRDPFLSLYLVEDKKGFRYPFKINNRTSKNLASLTNNSILEGRIAKKQIGLDSFATFSQCFFVPSILTDNCCFLEAIATPKGIIEKAYIKRFIKAKDVFYGDIGIRVADEDKKVIVKACDPFMKNNPFKKGDCIITFNFHKITSASFFMKEVLFSKVDSICRIKVKRGNSFITFKVLVHKRYGGGYLSDTFLEQKGIYFSKNLAVVKLEKGFKNYGLKIGDKLIKVNGVDVKSEADLRKYIENFKDFSSLLFEREDFQFFVNVN